jgi:hypothetical protein
MKKDLDFWDVEAALTRMARQLSGDYRKQSAWVAVRVADALTSYANGDKQPLDDLIARLRESIAAENREAE